MFKTPTSFTPKLIIEKVLRKAGDECNGWAVTEAHERGDGVWAKVRLAGSTVVMWRVLTCCARA